MHGVLPFHHHSITVVLHSAASWAEIVQISPLGRTLQESWLPHHMKEALGVLARGTLRLWSQNVFCWGLLTSGIWHVSVEAVCVSPSPLISSH